MEREYVSYRNEIQPIFLVRILPIEHGSGLVFCGLTAISRYNENPSCEGKRGERE